MYSSIDIKMPNQILMATSIVIKKSVSTFIRNGIEVEKGAVITESRIIKYRKIYEKYCELWSIYPDLFLDLIKRTDSRFNLFFYQRLFLRLIMRHGRIAVIAPRAFSKSFISILGMYLMCIFRPGIKLFICAPGKARKIAPCRREAA